MAAAPEVADVSPGGHKLLRGLGGALGTMAGLHLQYAQREAADDAGRVFSGVLLAALGVLLVAVALVMGHVGLVVYLHQATKLDLLGSVLAVGAGDLGMGLVLMITARARLKRPVLKQTRDLVRQTVERLVEPGEA